MDANLLESQMESLEFCQSKYSVETEIGEGAFSFVFKARCKITDERVAIKSIAKTTSPSRIIEELKILRALNGKENCIKVLEVLRNEDQVVVVFPLVKYIDFKDFIEKSTFQDVRKYMYNLLIALRHVHSKNIMHRDIKPGNFLYNIEEEQGVLIDFGLAQYEKTTKKSPQKHPKPIIFFNSIVTPCKPPGYYEHDTRPQLKAPRAGTRGFRAPEVLFRVDWQSKAIDVWSAGVIMLCILTGQYPFFISVEDADGLVELGIIFGHARMRKAAKQYGRVWKSNLPTITEQGIPFEQLTKSLNPNLEVDGNAISLLERLLDLNCETRISAMDAVEHPFFASFKET